MDSDGDGLSDALEQRLLDRFQPRFMVAAQDCSVSPAQFRQGALQPEVVAENGTIYGQVSPARDASPDAIVAEIHFYQLWRKDCGSHGHPLDTEHVAIQVRASGSDPEAAEWHATYWYAAAHENTVCDVSQIARASTLGAVEHGATVWVSAGKHASYLNRTLCQRGCGADRCERMVALPQASSINLGEPGRPMNGSTFIASAAWPLAEKMSVSNFPPDAIRRLQQLPETDIAWFHAGRHPAQGVIARSSATGQSIAESGRDVTTAISVAGTSTGNALASTEASTSAAVSSTGDATGRALHKSYQGTRKALGASARGVGRALRMGSKDSEQPKE